MQRGVLSSSLCIIWFNPMLSLINPYSMQKQWCVVVAVSG
jgi:hypothetical protein